jgi:ElaB/YqjD/DUF883 family membrane-anchored ribosome-binding protein
MAAKRRRKSQGDAERPGEGEGSEAAETAEASQDESGGEEAAASAGEGAQAAAPTEQPAAETRPARRAEPSASPRNVRELGRQTAASYQQSRESAAEFVTTARDRIREQPIQSVLVAAGVGVLIGLIWR